MRSFPQELSVSLEDLRPIPRVISVFGAPYVVFGIDAYAVTTAKEASCPGTHELAHIIEHQDGVGRLPAVETVDQPG